MVTFWLGYLRIKNVKILYLADHAVLEYDDLRVYSKIIKDGGILSTGIYADPSSPSADVRPPISDILILDEAREYWKEKNLSSETCLQDAEFVAMFDIIIVVHRYKLLLNCDLPQRPLVIYRTIGGNTPGIEAAIAPIRSRLKIVRYSPNEQFLKSFVGADTVIRFGKELGDFKIYRGDNNMVTTFYLNANRRLKHCNFEFYELATRPFHRQLIGSGNPSVEWGQHRLPYDDMMELYSRSSVYFCKHTIPASYTLNFMEAMLAGAPIVTIGRKVVRHSDIPEAEDLSALYEVPEILHGSPVRLDVDDVITARRTIALLLRDRALAISVSEWLRNRGAALFDASAIADQWRDFLESAA
jgi:hypothetical protein